MYSPDMSLEEFTAAATAFLDANLERKEAEKTFVWGEGSDKVNVFEERTRQQELEMLEESKAWRRKKFDAGFGWITGPAEFGGAGLTPAHERVFNRLESTSTSRLTSIEPIRPSCMRSACARSSAPAAAIRPRSPLESICANRR